MSGEIKKCLAAGCFCEHVPVDVQETLALLTKDTRFTNRYLINQAPDSGKINLYLLCSTPPGPLRSLSNNCGYLGEGNIIVCDYRFLSHFLKDEGILTPSLFEDEVKGLQSSFLLWVIGHEIGHLTLGHEYSHFKSLDRQLARRSSNSISANETLADRFVYERLAGDQKRKEAFNLLLLHMIDVQLRKKEKVPPVIGVFPYYFGTSPLPVVNDHNSHPDFLVRSIVLVDLVMRNNPAMHHMVVSLQKRIERIEKPSLMERLLNRIAIH